jgi:hypothetical protein
MRFQIVFTFFLFQIITVLSAQNTNNLKYYPVLENIFVNKCGKCHNLTENSPFSLLKYEDVLKNRNMIRKVIAEEIMPPVIIDTTYKTFHNVITLSQEERKNIINWIDNGLLKGDKKASKIKTVKQKTKVKTSFKINLDRHLALGETNKDQYVFSVFSLPIKDSIILSNYEFVIKNKHLHHAELLDLQNYYGIPENMDILNADYELNKKEISIDRYLIGWFPGSSGGVFPKNTGLKLFGDRKYMLILHYSPTLEKHVDKSYIKMEEQKLKDYREVLEYGLHGTAKYIQENKNQPFIKANEIKEFYFKDTVSYDMSAFAVYFHAHHLCEKMLAYAVTPENDTIRLLKIDKWNFNWQFTYRLDKYLKIPQGSIIHCFATYNNTIENIENPFNPPQDIKASFFSDDEMLEFFILHLNYSEEDEFKKIEYNN